MSLAFCTVFTRNTLAAAKSLAESVRAAHPEARVFGLLVDRPAEALREAELPFELVELPELGLPGLHHMAFRYTALAMCCVCKAHLLLHLLERADIRKVVYLDSDVLVLDRLDAALALLSESAVILTPHTRAPLPLDGKSPDDDAISDSGVFNAGFVGVANAPAARRFLSWWGATLARDYGIDPRHRDQKILELAPAHFPELAVLREPGYNVAYWNLHERPVTREGARFFAGGQPLVFFHFSGYDPDVPGEPSRHQNRYRMDQVGAAAELFARYRARLELHGRAQERALRYGFGFFDDGIPVSEVVRRCFARTGESWGAPQSPFDGEGPSAFRNWCRRPDGNGGIAPVLHDVFAMRPDVRAAYPDPAGRDREAAHAWILDHGHECGLPFPPARVPAGPRPDGPPGFNVLGFLRSEKGLGRAARSVVRALAAAGVPHAPNDWFDPGSANTVDALLPARRAQPHPVNLLLINAVGMHEVDHYLPGYRDGRVNIGYWNWELEWFPEDWRRAFEALDEVWTPSRFVARAVAALSPVPVRVVPYAVEPLPGAGQRTRAHLSLPEGRFVFLTSCDLASCLERKNPLGAIRAFRRAFGLRRDVLLVVKILGALTRPADLAAVVLACGGQPNIRLLDRVLDDAELGALHDHSDAYVSLHRAEGFGFPLAEAMAAGKPVIATAYSGNQDFMDHANSLPVPYRLVPVAEAWGPYPRGAVWADPDEDAAVESMRALVADRALGVRIGAAARAHVTEHLSPARVGARLREHLERIDARSIPLPGRLSPV